MSQDIADLKLIKEILEQCTANTIATGSKVSLSTVKKLKSGERSVEKLNLSDAIKITNFAVENSLANIKIEVWK